MASTILTVLLIGTLYTLVLTQTPNSTVSEAVEPKVLLTEAQTKTEVGDVFVNQTERIDDLDKTRRQEILQVIQGLNKKAQEIKNASIFNSSRIQPVSADKRYQVLVLRRSNVPVQQPASVHQQPEEQFYYYTKPLNEYHSDPSPLYAYNRPRSDRNRGSFSVFDRRTPEQPAGLPVRQILEGPINIAIPLQSQEIAVYFVNRGIKSVKFTPSLRTVDEALTRHSRKTGLTIAAAYNLRSRYLSWPVKSVTFADPVFLADIRNTGTYPTILFVPEDDLEPSRLTSDIFKIGDFSLLEDGIKYSLPSESPVYESEIARPY